MKVRLRIDSVSLEGLGLGPHQEPALRAALEAELAARFRREEEFGSSSTRRVVVRASELGADSDLLGRQIGRAIHGSVPRHAE